MADLTRTPASIMEVISKADRGGVRYLRRLS
jgi:hypothetical protein